MRKADYSALAQIIKKQSAHYSDIATGKPLPGTDLAHQAIASIAYSFSNAASVDKAEFLKACGID